MRMIVLRLWVGLLVVAAPTARAWAVTPGDCGLTSNDASSGITIEACLGLGYRPGDVWVKGDFAYVGSISSSSVFVYDISDVSAPVEVREITGPGGDLVVSDVVVGDNDVVYISYYCALSSCSPVHKDAKAQTCASFSTGSVDNPSALDPDGHGIHNLRYDQSTGTLYGAYLNELTINSLDGVAWWDVGSASCTVGNFTLEDTNMPTPGGTHDIFIQDVGSTKYLLGAESERMAIYDITSGPGSVGVFAHVFTCTSGVCSNVHTIWPIDDVRYTVTDEAVGGRLFGLLRTTSATLTQKGSHQVPIAKADSYHQQMFDAPYLYAAAYQAGVRVWKRDSHANLLLYAYFDTSDFSGFGGGSGVGFGRLAGAYAAHSASHGVTKRYFVVTSHDGDDQVDSDENQLFILSHNTSPGLCGPSGCKTSSASQVPSVTGGASGLLVATSTDDALGQVGTLALYPSGTTGFSSPTSITQTGLTSDHRFGQVVVVGDFNSDGWQDAAVGAPGQAVSSVAGGVVYIYPGGSSGFGSPTLLTQSASGLGTNVAGDLFGHSLATGDFNRDGIADLAVGAPGATETTGVAAGAVFVFAGGTTGLAGQAVLAPNSPYLEDDRFGTALASADVNGDGYADLAVGAPRARYATTGAYGGVVFVYKGSSTGLAFAARKNQTSLDTDEPGDNFGASLATGDFNGDGLSDLAVGAWGEHLADVSSGAVYVFLGTRTSSVLLPWSTVEQSALDQNEEEDMFGWSLAAGDFTNDGLADLVVGAPGEMPGNDPRAGTIHLFYGTTASLRAKSVLDQTAFSATNADQDAFGLALAPGDYDRNGKDDIVVLAPGLVAGNSGNPGFVYKGATAGLGSWLTLTLP